MENNNPQATPNAEGINIENILGQGLPPSTPVDVPNTNEPPANPPASTDPVTPPVNPNPAPTDTPPAENPNPNPNEPPAEKTIEQILLSADGLSQEDAELRTNIFSQFGATSADANGNLLDANGQVILSKEHLDDYIDNGTLLLDKDGNHVNELGQIITPASEVIVTHNLVNTAKSTVEQEFGFQFLDTQGQPKSYDNTPEGTAELVKDAIANTQVNAIASFLNADERVKQFYYHLQTGGTPENFTNDSFDYTSIDLDGLNREQKINYIKTSLDKQGVKNQGTFLKMLETASDEVLTESTSDALIALNKISEDNKKQKEAEYNALVEKQQKANEDYWNGIKSRIDSGKLKDISIPNEEREKFFDYIAVVKDNQGRTQEQIDSEQDQEFNLMVSYLRYKKLNLNDLINIRARGNKLHNARDRFNIKNPSPVQTKQVPNSSTNEIISLERLNNN